MGFFFKSRSKRAPRNKSRALREPKATTRGDGRQCAAGPRVSDRGDERCRQREVTSEPRGRPCQVSTLHPTAVPVSPRPAHRAAPSSPSASSQPSSVPCGTRLFTQQRLQVPARLDAMKAGIINHHVIKHFFKKFFVHVETGRAVIRPVRPEP